jgi:hypothetical protein
MFFFFFFLLGPFWAIFLQNKILYHTPEGVAGVVVPSVFPLLSSALWAGYSTPSILLLLNKQTANRPRNAGDTSKKKRKTKQKLWPEL